MDSSIRAEESPSAEWSRTLSSCVEAQILRANYDELWDRHMNSSCEITTDLYAEMARRHNDLWELYEQALKSHSMLQCGLQRFARQLTIPDPPSVCSKSFVAIADLTMITVRRLPFFQLS